jgi:hypothetical protein
MSREQIAETIGVTVGSLQVTCSRHGISLKRPKLNNGVAHAPRSRKDTPAQDRRVQLALRRLGSKSHETGSVVSL